jgi:glycosyltransferase involved in cell wall biosynthesis
VTPAVSIGLPVHNGERYLANAIESVLAQTFGDFELLISDNASTDRTQEIGREIARSDPRVRYQRLDSNIGPVGNHNRCIDLARGRYFMWLASDDLLGETQVERCVEALETEPKAAMSFPRLTYIDEAGAVIGAQTTPDLSIVADDAGARAWQLVKHELAGVEIYSTFYSLMRRAALDRTRMHGTYVAADQVLLFELLLAGKLVQVQGAEFLRRIHEESSMVAHRTPEERAVWFGSDGRRRIPLVHWRLLAEHGKAVGRSAVPVRSKVRAYAAVAYRAAHEWRNLGGDFKDAARAVRARRAGRREAAAA